MKKRFCFSVLLLMLMTFVIFLPQSRAFFYSLLPASLWTQGMAYAQIKDISHPTLKDYLIVQKYLTEGRRPNLSALEDTKNRAAHLKIIDPSSQIIPSLQILSCNNENEEKENCILIYASLNRHFPLGVQRMVEHLGSSDFKGDVLYRIGGWPNIEDGDLELAPVPYAFKICFFKEAKRLGYKRALWLDSSIIPIVSLNSIFARIKEKGYFCMGNFHQVGPFFNEKAAQALGVSLEESFQIPSCSAGLFGVDFSNEKAHQSLIEWERAARDPFAFYSTRSDQNALSVILYKLGATEFAPLHILANSPDKISSDTLFQIDKKFIVK